MLVSDKIFVKSMKYDTKLYTYDTEYDTKTINQNDNLCYIFYILPKIINDNLCKHTNYAH